MFAAASGSLGRYSGGSRYGSPARKTARQHKAQQDQADGDEAIHDVEIMRVLGDAPVTIADRDSMIRSTQLSISVSVSGSGGAVHFWKT